MDEKPDQIMNHIEAQRDQLGRNLNELESRVKRAADWRNQFDRNPMLMMGVALGGGLLLGTMTGSSSRRSGSSRSSWSPSSSSSSKGYGAAGISPSSSYSAVGSGTGSSAYGSGSGSAYGSSHQPMSEQRRKASETLDHIKSALIGFATAKVKEFMTEALPGFNTHLDEAERRFTGGQSTGHSQTGYGQTGSQGQTGNQGQSGSGSGYSGSGQSSGSGYQPSNAGGTRTEQSAQTPYRQDPVNTGVNR
jgi:hypothetical protein